MSKMKMPEMSVVRFHESDVIVASITRVYMQGWSDDTKENGTARDQKDGDIIYASFRAGDMSSFFGNATFYRDASVDEPISVSTLEGDDRIGQPINNFDGYYAFDGKIWEKQ